MLKKMRLWLMDGMYDVAPGRTWDWLARWVERPTVHFLCLVGGHEPIQDNCRIPAHDICAYCSRSMPEAAPR